MKLVLIAYNEAVEERVMALLSRTGAETYTKWTKVLGKGRASGPHLSTHVWPKANNVVATCLEDASAGQLMDGVRSLRQDARQEGIKAFLLPVEDVT